MKEDNGASSATNGLPINGAEQVVSAVPVGIPSAIADIIEAVQRVSSNAMYRGNDNMGLNMAKAFAFVEEVEVKKSCGSCGHPKHDYTYVRVTLAGKAYLALAQAIETRRAETLGSVEDESAVATPCAQQVSA